MFNLEWNAHQQERAEQIAEYYFANRPPEDVREAEARVAKKEARKLAQAKAAQARRDAEKKLVAEKQHWTLDSCRQAAGRFGSKIEWKRGCSSSYRAACANGWISMCSGHMTRPKKWDLETLKKDARKHRSRGEWQRKNPSAYQTAWRLGLLEVCVAHMTPKATDSQRANKTKMAAEAAMVREVKAKMERMNEAKAEMAMAS
jgi:hypothetical protein